MVDNLIKFSITFTRSGHFPILIAGEIFNNKDISFRVTSSSELRPIQLIGQFRVAGVSKNRIFLYS